MHKGDSLGRLDYNVIHCYKIFAKILNLFMYIIIIQWFTCPPELGLSTIHGVIT